MEKSITLVLVLAASFSHIQCCGMSQRSATQTTVRAETEIVDEWPKRIECNGIVLLRVPKGTRRIGTDNTRAGVGEGPAFVYTLDYIMYMAETEITAKQFRSLMGTWTRPVNQSRVYARPDFGDSYPDNLPAFGKWDVANEFCRRFEEILEDRTGWEWDCRLPKEAEWEYVACFGRAKWEDWWPRDEYLLEHEWYRENAWDDGVHAVAMKKPNLLGFYDMLGNMEEWCDGRLADHEAVRLACGGTVVESVESIESAGIYNGRPTRGGNTLSDRDGCRPSKRGGWGTTTDTNGFRVVAIPVPPYCSTLLPFGRTESGDEDGGKASE